MSPEILLLLLSSFTISWMKSPSTNQTVYNFLWLRPSHVPCISRQRAHHVIASIMRIRGPLFHALYKIHIFVLFPSGNSISTWPTKTFHFFIRRINFFTHFFSAPVRERERERETKNQILVRKSRRNSLILFLWSLHLKRDSYCYPDIERYKDEISILWKHLGLI